MLGLIYVELSHVQYVYAFYVGIKLYKLSSISTQYRIKNKPTFFSFIFLKLISNYLFINFRKRKVEGDRNISE